MTITVNYPFKKGYEEGLQMVEVNNGNVDVVFFNSEKEKVPRFYFYRFGKVSKVTEMLGHKITGHNNRDVVGKADIEELFKPCGLSYQDVLDKLVEKAVSDGMSQRYDM